MVDILENPEIRQLVKKLTVREYEQLGESMDDVRAELIRGVLIENMPPSPRHSFLIEQFVAAIREVVGPAAYCRQEQPLKLRDSMPQPDLAVVAGQAEDYLDAHPSNALLVVEIAVTSIELDHEKAALYAEAGIMEYWIVIANDKTVEVYTAAEAGAYAQQRVYTRDEILVSSALPGLRIELSALFSH